MRMPWQAVITTAAMDEATRSAWRRKQGLYPAELEAWKQDSIAGLSESRAASAVEARQDRRRVRESRRPAADRNVPLHSLSEVERARIIVVANEPRFAATPPARTVTALADEGISPASPASIACSVRMAR